MARGPFGQTSPANGVSHGLLNQRFVNVMPPFAGLRVLPPVLLGEGPLPTPFSGRVGILAVQGVGHLHPPPAFGQVPLMNPLGLSQMILKRFLERFREHRHAVFAALAVAP